MYQAGTNEPSGKGYSQEFSRWLAANKLDDMDKSDRAKLFKVMDNLAEIEAWRAKLTLSERLKLNHPVTVLRNYQEWVKLQGTALDADEDGDEAEILEDPPVEDDGLTLEQAVLRALARRSDVETMDHHRKTRLLRHIEELADWAREHLASAEEKLDPESQRLVDQAVENVLTKAGGDE